MSKRQLSAREILQDIRAGMDDTALMDKYRLSAQGLQGVFKKLIAAGVIKQAEVDRRASPRKQTVNPAWKCPACGKPQPREFEECPDCAVIVSKFSDRDARAAAGPNSTKEPLQVTSLRNGSFGYLGALRGSITAIVAGCFIITLLGWYTLHLRDENRRIVETQRIEAERQAKANELKLYEPMRNEIARDRKMLEMGLSVSDHRTMAKSFVQRLGELQLGLKGQQLRLVFLLEDAAKNLQDAGNAWEREVDCDVMARKHWCIDSTHEQLYNQSAARRTKS